MTKTMQPVLPNPFSLEAASPDWWYGIRQQTNQLVEEMIARRGDSVKHLTIEFQDTELVMNEQHEWDCQHASSHPETFIDDDTDDMLLEVCNECDKYYDDRINEWLAND